MNEKYQPLNQFAELIMDSADAEKKTALEISPQVKNLQEALDSAIEKEIKEIIQQDI